MLVGGHFLTPFSVVKHLDMGKVDDFAHRVGHEEASVAPQVVVEYKCTTSNCFVTRESK